MVRFLDPEIIEKVDKSFMDKDYPMKNILNKSDIGKLLVEDQ